MAISDLLSAVFLLACVLISLISSTNNSSVIGGLLLSLMLFNLYYGPCFLHHNNRRHSWEHVHIVLASADHSLLSVICHYLKEKSGHNHGWRSHERWSRVLEPYNLNCEWRRVKESEPRLVFHCNNWHNHRWLVSKVERSESFGRRVISNERAIWSFTGVPHALLLWIDIKLFAGTKCADFGVHETDANIYTGSVYELNTETIVFWWDWSRELSNLCWLDSLFTWWCATHFESVFCFKIYIILILFILFSFLKLLF